MQSGFVPSMTAFSVPQHKPICTIAFGGSVRIARVSACPRKGRASLFSRQRELAGANAAVSATCLSTSVPHSSGTCLETGIYTTSVLSLVSHFLSFAVSAHVARLHVTSHVLYRGGYRRSVSHSKWRLTPCVGKGMQSNNSWFHMFCCFSHCSERRKIYIYIYIYREREGENREREREREKKRDRERERERARRRER